MNYTAQELRDIADAKDALDKGFPVQQRYGEDEEWLPLGNFGIVMSSSFENRLWYYRPTPKPETRPWTPAEAIGKCVGRKDADVYFLVSGLSLKFNTIYISSEDGGEWVEMKRLLANFIQANGSPCGVQVEVKE